MSIVMRVVVLLKKVGSPFFLAFLCIVAIESVPLQIRIPVGLFALLLLCLGFYEPAVPEQKPPQ